MKEQIADFLEIFTDTSKTLIMTCLIVLGAVFRVKGLIDGGQMVDIVKTTSIAYFSTVTAVHFVEMVKTHLQDKANVILDSVKEKHNES
jgi:hypothetical protein